MVRPIETPVAGPEAFGVESAAASLSRAAILLLLRAQLRGDDQALAARSVAPPATSLARVAPADPRLARLTEPGDRRRGGAPAYTSLLVHGTFARNFPWWQPGGGFHTYLSGVLGDLYGASDRFEWSGGYSDERRALGAQDLGVWVDAHNVQGLDLLAHSHGGSVAMLASQFGLELGKLVLLSCPAHPQKYMPDFGHVGKVVSVRVHLDLVILADGGGQRFRHPDIRENVLPIWFDHSATHDPDVWETYDIPSKL